MLLQCHASPSHSPSPFPHPPIQPRAHPNKTSHQCFHFDAFVGSTRIPQTFLFLHQDVVLHRKIERSALITGTFPSLFFMGIKSETRGSGRKTTVTSASPTHQQLKGTHPKTVSVSPSPRAHMRKSGNHPSDCGHHAFERWQGLLATF